MPNLTPSKTKCCLCGCRGVNGVYSFPSAKYQDIYEKWMVVLSELEMSVSSLPPTEVRQNFRICENHFKEDDFFIAHRSNRKRKKLLKHNSVPTLNNVVAISVNDQTTNSEAEQCRSQTSNSADADVIRTGASTKNSSIENMYVSVACTDFIPSLTSKGARDAQKLYELCLRQRETIAKQRDIIEDLKLRLKRFGHETQSDNNHKPLPDDYLNHEFVTHQKQYKKKPRGRRYTDDMKSFGVQMLEQGSIADYEKWRKLFVMPSRRTLKRAAKRKTISRTNTDEELSEDPQITSPQIDSYETSLENLHVVVVNDTSENELTLDDKPPSLKLVCPSQD